MSTFDVAEYESFHNRLRTVRKQLKINQAEVAGAIGLAQGALSKMEAGERQPTVEQVAALEAYFAPYGVPAGWLTGSGAQHAAAVIAESGDFVTRVEHEMALSSARAAGIDAHAFADRLSGVSAELLSIANDLIERAPLATKPLPPAAVAAAVAGVLEGQVTVEEAITEAQVVPGTPEDWADVAIPPTPSVAPLPPAPLPEAPSDPGSFNSIGHTIDAPASSFFAQPVQAAADEDPLAAIFGAPPVPQVVTTTVEQPTYEVPPVAPPVAIETLLGFAQPAAVEA